MYECRKWGMGQDKGIQIWWSYLLATMSNSVSDWMPYGCPLIYMLLPKQGIEWIFPNSNMAIQSHTQITTSYFDEVNLA